MQSIARSHWINHGIPVAATQRRRRERGQNKIEKEEGREGRREKRQGGEGRKREGRKKREGRRESGKGKGGVGGAGGNMLELVRLSKSGTHVATGPGIIYDVSKMESAAFGATN